MKEPFRIFSPKKDGVFLLRESSGGTARFYLKAPNGSMLGESIEFNSRAQAEKGIEKMRAMTEFDHRRSHAGYHFEFKDGDSVLFTSKAYRTLRGARDGGKAVMKVGKEAQIQRASFR